MRTFQCEMREWDSSWMDGQKDKCMYKWMDGHVRHFIRASGDDLKK